MAIAPSTNPATSITASSTTANGSSSALAISARLYSERL